MQPRNVPVLAEFLFLVVPVVLFIVLLMILVHTLGYNSLILEWIAAIALLTASILLLTILIIRKVVMLKELKHQANIRQAYRDFNLAVYTKKVVHPIHAIRSRNRRIYY